MNENLSAEPVRCQSEEPKINSYCLVFPALGVHPPGCLLPPNTANRGHQSPAGLAEPRASASGPPIYRGVAAPWGVANLRLIHSRCAGDAPTEQALVRVEFGQTELASEIQPRPIAFTDPINAWAE